MMETLSWFGDSGVGDLIQTDKIMNAETQSLIHNAIPFGKHLIGCKDSVNWKQHNAIPKFFYPLIEKLGIKHYESRTGPDRTLLKHRGIREQKKSVTVKGMSRLLEIRRVHLVTVKQGERRSVHNLLPKMTSPSS